MFQTLFVLPDKIRRIFSRAEIFIFYDKNISQWLKAFLTIKRLCLLDKDVSPQIEIEQSRHRVENMSSAQIESQRSRHRLENMSSNTANSSPIPTSGFSSISAQISSANGTYFC
jgi:hypothetical protein